MEALETIGYIPAPTGPIRALTNGFDRLQGSLFFRGHQYNEGDSGSQVDFNIELTHADKPGFYFADFHIMPMPAPEQGVQEGKCGLRRAGFSRFFRRAVHPVKIIQCGLPDWNSAETSQLGSPEPNCAVAAAAGHPLPIRAASQ